MPIRVFVWRSSLATRSRPSARTMSRARAHQKPEGDRLRVAVREGFVRGAREQELEETSQNHRGLLGETFAHSPLTV